MHLVSYIETSFVIRRKYRKRFWPKIVSLLVGINWGFGIWELGVVISFNNSESSSSSSPVDVGLRPNHVNHCVLFFPFSYSFLPIIILCCDLHNTWKSSSNNIIFTWLIGNVYARLTLFPIGESHISLTAIHQESKSATQTTNKVISFWTDWLRVHPIGLRCFSN